MSAIEQLLAGDSPRLFWTPERVWTNERFRMLAGGVSAELERALRAAAERSDSAQLPVHALPGYVGLVFPFRADGRSGVLAAFFSRSALEPLVISSLGATLDDLQALSNDGRRPDAYVRRVFDAGGALFSDYWLLQWRDSGTFVPVRRGGTSPYSGLLHRWQPHRFRRLLESRTGAIIAASDGRRALAIPFERGRDGRFIGLLELRDGRLDDVEWAFLKAIAARGPTNDEAQSSPPASSVGTSVRTGRAVARVAFFGGPPALAERLAGVIAQRDWSFEHVRYLPDLLRLARTAARPDVFVVAHPSPQICALGMRSIRGIPAIKSVPVLALLKDSTEGSRVNADIALAPDAPAEQIVDRLEQLLKLRKRRRREALDRELDALEGELQAAIAAQHIAETASRWLTQQLAGWTYVRFCRPGDAAIVVQPEVGLHLDAPPASILEGIHLIQARLEDGFLERVSADSRFVAALRKLNPRSGASLLLGSDGHIFGGVLCFAFDRYWDESEIDALVRYAEIVSRAFAAVSLDRMAAVLQQPG
ncbi:MAG TPA: hypothetical protein VJP76_02455 [Candidatus Tumulicola sp.]|nr:hypothetical protein [Candidatus Tumulicola sp.]